MRLNLAVHLRKWWHGQNVSQRFVARMLNAKDFDMRIDLSDGAIVLVDRLAKKDWPDEENARNVFRVNSDLSVVWRISSAFDAAGDPFTAIHWKDGKLEAYRWDSVTYDVDLDTGFATPLRLDRF